MSGHAAVFSPPGALRLQVRRHHRSTSRPLIRSGSRTDGGHSDQPSSAAAGGPPESAGRAAAVHGRVRAQRASGATAVHGRTSAAVEGVQGR